MLSNGLLLLLQDGKSFVLDLVDFILNLDNLFSRRFISLKVPKLNDELGLLLNHLFVLSFQFLLFFDDQFSVLLN